MPLLDDLRGQRDSARAGSDEILTREAAETARAFRSAIFAKNPAPIEVRPAAR